VHAKPRRGAPQSVATWASQGAATMPALAAEGPGSATQVAAEDAPPATPIPTVDANEAGVAPASTTEPDDDAWEAAPLRPQAPEFLAPSSIQRQ
jgi:hypothetical protein